jgi:hypothetical protein
MNSVRSPSQRFPSAVLTVPRVKPYPRIAHAEHAREWPKSP